MLRTAEKPGNIIFEPPGLSFRKQILTAMLS